MSLSFDATFVVGLAFLIFAGLCWRLLREPIRIYLDQCIEEVRDAWDVHRKILGEMEYAYQQVHQRLLVVDQEIVHLRERANEDLTHLKTLFEQDLEEFLSIKDKAFLAKSHQLYLERIHHLRQEITSHILELFVSNLQGKASKRLLKDYTQLSLRALGEKENLDF